MGECVCEKLMRVAIVVDSIVDDNMSSVNTTMETPELSEVMKSSD